MNHGRLKEHVRRYMLGLLGVVVLVGGLAEPVAAHEPGTSAVEFQVTDSGLEVEVDMPVDELGDAIGQEVPTDVFGLSQSRDLIVDYFTSEFAVVGADGTEWPLTIDRLTVVRVDGTQFLRAAVSLTGPDVDTSTTFTVRDSAIVENDDTHQVIVTLVETDGDAVIVGILDAENTELDVARTELGDVAGADEFTFLDTVRYGFDHVLAGADHLLFLLTLLLPAPLVAVSRRWSATPGLWSAAKSVVHVATAFAIGHSISLAASALGWVSLPTRPIEILIAASVGVSAIHAMRPLTSRGEIRIAAGFGLVHGLAFAEIINDFGLGEANTLRTLVAFNLGVEAAQLITIAAAIPALWLLSRTRAYPAFRMMAASVALVASSAWILDRIEVMSNPFTRAEDGAIDNLAVLGVGLLLIAFGVWVADRRMQGDGDHTATTCRARLLCQRS